jgi:hypothetical protein
MLNGTVYMHLSIHCFSTAETNEIVIWVFDTYFAARDWTDISLTLILFTVPLWLTKTTCSSLSSSSAIEFTDKRKLQIEG